MCNTPGEKIKFKIESHSEYISGLCSSTLHIANTPLTGRRLKQRLFSYTSTTYHFIRTSYPSLLIGGCGSGRSRALLGMLEQNFSSREPFVYMNGKGDTSSVAMLYAAAKNAGVQDDLYVINGYALDASVTHTFDPINPLVGDLQSFEAVFGKNAGKMLNEQCEIFHKQGLLIDFDVLETLLDLTSLKTLALNADMPRPFLVEYLKSLGNRVKAEIKRHGENMEKAKSLIATLKTMPMCSFDPDLDLKSIFLESKFLCVSLPALEKDPDRLQVIEDLFLCQLSRALPENYLSSANPSFVIDGGYTPSINCLEILNRFAHTRSVLGYEYLTDDKHKYAESYRTIAKMAQSVILIKIEDQIPDFIKMNAFDNGISRWNINVRDIVNQSPGHATVWGNIATKNKGFLGGSRKFDVQAGIKRIEMKHFNPDMAGLDIQMTRIRIAKPVI